MHRLPVSENSYWRDFYPEQNLYSELLEDVTVDVVIVGAGITGMTTAYLLKKAGLTVAVLDKSTVGGGTTGRTTGKVTSQHGLNYDKLRQKLGRGTAQTYANANQAAINQIEAIITTERIECDWHRADNYVYTTDPKRITTFKQEAIVSNDLGLPASFETSSPLPFAIQAAIKYTDQANINAQKYVLGLAKSVDGDGSYVFEHSTVIGIRDGKPGRVKTAKAKVTADHIIVTSSVPTLPLIARVSYAAKEYPMESYIVAGTMPGELKGMYISPDKDNYSILPTEIAGRPMLLIGGEGHIWGLRGNRQARFERLAAYASKHFGVQTISNRWSDRDYLAHDNVPVVGKMYPWSKELYVATAFKKWGLSNGTVAAMILRDTLVGTKNPWAKTFDSRRSILFK